MSKRINKQLGIGLASAAVLAGLYLNSNVVKADNVAPEATASQTALNKLSQNQDNSARISEQSEEDSTTTASENSSTDEDNDSTLPQETTDNAEDSQNQDDYDEDLESDMQQYKKDTKIYPQVAIQGEVPELDPSALLNGAGQHYYHMTTAVNSSESDDDGYGAKAEWIKAPDVSKEGNVTGKAKVTYRDDYSDEEKSVELDIPINVRRGQKKQVGESRNTINVIDSNDNQIIFSESWLGKPTTDEDEGHDNDADLYSDLIKSLGELGYIKVDDPEAYNDSSYVDINRFSKNDKVYNYLVKKVVDKPMEVDDPSIYEKTEGEVNPINSNPWHDVDVSEIDPADFVYGLATLDPDETVDWKTKPVLEKNAETDSYVVKNDPVIAIKKAGKTIQTISGDYLKHGLEIRSMGTGYGTPKLVSKIVVSQDGEMPDANKVIKAVPVYSDEDITYSTKQSDLEKHKASWVIAPDLSHVGYQYDIIKFLESEGDVNGYSYATVLVQVTPRPTVKSDSKKVTRTIRYKTPTGYESIPDEIENIEFTRSSSYDHLSGKTTYGDWNVQGEYFNNKDVHQIKGYTSLVDNTEATSVGRIKVAPNSDNILITVTYKAQPNTVSNETEKVTRTIHYNVPDGYETIPDKVQTAEFSRTKTVDPKTDKATYSAWTPDKAQFDEVAINPIKGFDAYVDGTKANKVSAKSVTANDKDFVVTVTYEAQPNTVSNETEKVTRTIHYNVPDGYEAIPDKVQTAEFSRTKTIDPKTDKITYGVWTPAKGQFDQVNVHQINGYVSLVDGKKADKVLAEVVNANTKNNTVQVTYDVVVKPATPDTPATPSQPTNEPSNPTQPTNNVPEVPAQPETKPEQPTNQPSQPTQSTDNTVSKPQTSTANSEPQVQPSTPVNKENTPAPAPLNNGEKAKANNQGSGDVRPVSIKTPKSTKTVQAAVVNNDNGKQQLPQTGENQNSIIAVMGAAIAAVASIFGLASRKKND